MRLRQIALVAKDLQKARADIAEVLGLGPDYPDPGVGHFGLENAVWPIGDTFLEVVSPKQDGTTAGRLLEKRGGDGGYMAIFQVDDIGVARQRLADNGVRTVWNTDREGVWATHLHPKDIGGAIVSIDQMEPPAKWEWGGPDWQANVRNDVALEIVGCEIQAADPEAMRRRWTQVLGLEGVDVRFVEARDGRGDGLSAFDVRVRGPDEVRQRAQARGLLQDGEVVLCGTRVRLVS
ncbi:VOC family protein [Phenylobacterium sp.]|jgi:catechol 2,3-dioxygenase-like lactoylglutathione lyase family enzyme|uniref:VOC family protein n=1 Tax=Phenylobacterium sp. TaxID=1871053 RepID=UPI002F95C2DC